ncbi:stalk domain-containing protein [Paenibacillus kandeliae]|uniref:stalk domain-containing protein n=1 Tax=Paenibacillus kandeliae TaxID=3231269 RepID=UPI00345B1B2F
MKKGITSLLIGSALLVGTGTGALAATNLEKVTAYLNDQVKVEVDGSAATLKSADGTKVTPLTYEGTTYLPVRATADLLGADVKYNSTSGTIQFTTATGSTYGTNSSGASDPTSSSSSDSTGISSTDTSYDPSTDSSAIGDDTSASTSATSNTYTDTSTK